jgi:hypothetical protein
MLEAIPVRACRSRVHPTTFYLVGELGTNPSLRWFLESSITLSVEEANIEKLSEYFNSLIGRKVPGT